MFNRMRMANGGGATIAPPAGSIGTPYELDALTPSLTTGSTDTRKVIISTQWGAASELAPGLDLLSAGDSTRYTMWAGFGMYVNETPTVAAGANSVSDGAGGTYEWVIDLATGGIWCRTPLGWINGLNPYSGGLAFYTLPAASFTPRLTHARTASWQVNALSPHGVPDGWVML